MFRIDGELDKSITLAFAMQARQQSWADETGGAPGVLEFTSRSNVFPCMASHTMAHLNVSAPMHFQAVISQHQA